MVNGSCVTWSLRIHHQAKIEKGDVRIRMIGLRRESSEFMTWWMLPIKNKTTIWWLRIENRMFKFGTMFIIINRAYEKNLSPQWKTNWQKLFYRRKPKTSLQNKRSRCLWWKRKRKLFCCVIFWCIVGNWVFTSCISSYLSSSLSICLKIVNFLFWLNLMREQNNGHESKFYTVQYLMLMKFFDENCGYFRSVDSLNKRLSS